MGFYDDHIDAVAKRWQEKYRHSGLTLAEFKKEATKTLTGYGWNEQEVERILRNVK